MTKYILNSGNYEKYPQKMEKYFEEVFRDFENDKKQNIKILICTFAKPRSQWERIFQDIKSDFISFLAENNFLNLSFKMAMPDSFEKDSKDSDVIFIYGGDDNLLFYRFSFFDIEKVFENKVLALESAGSSYFSKEYWTCDWRKIMKGRGILPIKFIAHYKSDYGEKDIRGPIDWEKAKKELENFEDRTLPVYALKEGEFIVFEK